VIRFAFIALDVIDELPRKIVEVEGDPSRAHVADTN
jgi:hypothetical protein